MSQAQQDAYFAYINSSGLSKFAGSYAPKNSFFTPWQNRLDLSFHQELPVWRTVKVEVFVDFLNFGSWLSKGLFNYVEEINGSTTNSSQLRALGSATYNATGQVKPTVALNPDGSITSPPVPRSCSTTPIRAGASRAASG